MRRKKILDYVKNTKLKKNIQCSKCNNLMCSQCIKSHIRICGSDTHFLFFKGLNSEEKTKATITAQKLGHFVNEFDEMRKKILILLNDSELSQCVRQGKESLNKALQEITNIGKQEDIWKQKLRLLFEQLSRSASNSKALRKEYQAFLNSPKNTISEANLYRNLEARAKSSSLESQLENYIIEYSKYIKNIDNIKQQAQENTLFLRQARELNELKKTLNIEREKLTQFHKRFKLEKEEIMLQFQKQIKQIKLEKEEIMLQFQKQIKQIKLEKEEILLQFQKQIKQIKLEKEEIMLKFQKQIKQIKLEKEEIMLKFQKQIKQIKLGNKKIMLEFKKNIKIQNDITSKQNIPISVIQKAIKEWKCDICERYVLPSNCDSGNLIDCINYITTYSESFRKVCYCCFKPCPFCGLDFCVSCFNHHSCSFDHILTSDSEEYSEEQQKEYIEAFKVLYKFIKKNPNFQEGGEFDESGFYIQPDGSFFDLEGYYLNRFGYDELDGYYDEDGEYKERGITDNEDNELNVEYKKKLQNLKNNPIFKWIHTQRFYCVSDFKSCFYDLLQVKNQDQFFALSLFDKIKQSQLLE